MSLSAKVLTDPAALEALAGEWMALLERSPTNEPVLAPPWLLAWWSTFGGLGGRELRVVVFYEGTRLVGMAPLLRRIHWYWPGIPFRRIELLASGEEEEDETCSDYLGVVADRDHVESVMGELAKVLSQGRLGEFDELVLPGMDGSSGLPDWLVHALRAAGLMVKSTSVGAAPYIPLPSSWEAYLQRLSASHRYLVKRSLRDFDKWAGKRARYHRAENPDDLVAGKRVLHTLHGERWRAKGKQGVFESSRFNAFHDALLPDLLARGALELRWVTVDDEPIAIIYNIAWNRKVYFYQSGRKVDLPKGIRPGIVIHAHAIQAAIASGMREYDFLAGTSQYKTQLALASRPLVEVRAYRESLRERARKIAAGSLERLRALRESWRPRGEPGGGDADGTDREPRPSTPAAPAPPGQKAASDATKP